MPLLNIFSETVISIICFLLVLSFLVIIHELGHLITAIWMKIRVEEFGIGYPPKAKTLFYWKGIPFTLNWLPFGGFVKMEGEDGEDSIETMPTKIADNKENEKRKTHQDGFEPFYTKTKRARLLVLLAGVVINFLFGIIAFSIVYTVTGFPRIESMNERVIAALSPGSPAEAAGIQVGDRVDAAISLKDSAQTQESFATTEEFITYVNNHLDEQVRFFVTRSDQEIQFDVYLRPADKRPENEGALGVAGFMNPTVVYDFYPWWQMPIRAAVVGTQESVYLSYQILAGFGDIFSGIFLRAEIPTEVSGPIGIVHQTTKFELFKQGWDVVLKFAGMLSVNLAILNFLPIPALDGGRAFFVLTEGVIGKKRREAIEGRVNYIGFAFLMTLIVLISIKDVWGVIVDAVKFFG